MGKKPSNDPTYLLSTNYHLPSTDYLLPITRRSNAGMISRLTKQSSRVIIMSEKRDAYVEKLKAQIDEWNAEVAKLEAQAKKAQADAQARYMEEIDQLNERLAEGRAMLKEIQSANEAALNDLMQGAEKMWTAFEEAFRKARSRYQ